MIPELRRARLDHLARSTLREVLSAGPWLWPDEPAAMERARALVPEGPGPVQSGQALLLSVHPTTTSLWLLRIPHGQGPSAQRVVPLGAKAREAWTTAASVLPRSIPVLWHSVQALDRVPLEAMWLSSLAEPGCVEARESLIDGASFGLSMLLAMASQLFERPLPADVAASAAIDGAGAVQAVQGLERKARILYEHAPRVRRLLVAAEQADALGESLGGRLRVVGVSTVAEALEEVFGDELCSLLLRAGQDGSGRAELARAFFRLAIGGRGATVDWTPVAQAAGLAREHWSGLDAEQQQTLDFVRMVAWRHEGKGGVGMLPDDAWLGRLPAPVRLDVVAHVVQQSADTGEPEPTAALRLAERMLVRGPDAFVEHLRLLGALGRLRACTGAVRESMAMQAEAARGLLERMAAAELSYPLSEWYRLAGALGDREAFEEAEAVRAQAVQLRAPERSGQPYVALSRARAQVLLGSPERAQEVLAELANNPALAMHLRGSAVRWLVRAEEERGEAIDESALGGLHNVSGRETRTASRYLDLVELDRAVRQGRRQDADRAVASMQSREPGLLGNLLGSAPRGEGRAAWIAQFYPY